MLRPRITPCLLLRDEGLVKTVRFADPKYVGDPVNAVRIFNEKEADELDASSDHEVVIADHPLDAVELVEDELLLTLPYAPMHESDCGEGSGN